MERSGTMSPGFAFKMAVDEHIQKLDQGDHSIFTVHGTISAEAVLREFLACDKGYRGRNRPRRLFDRVQLFVEKLQDSFATLDGGVSCYPELSELLWSGVRFILQIIRKYSGYVGSISKVFEYITTDLEFYMNALHIDSVLTPEALAAIYGDIIAVCQAIGRLFLRQSAEPNTFAHRRNRYQTPIRFPTKGFQQVILTFEARHQDLEHRAAYQAVPISPAKFSLASQGDSEVSARLWRSTVHSIAYAHNSDAFNCMPDNYGGHRPQCSIDDHESIRLHARECIAATICHSACLERRSCLYGQHIRAQDAQDYCIGASDIPDTYLRTGSLRIKGSDDQSLRSEKNLIMSYDKSSGCECCFGRVARGSALRIPGACDAILMARQRSRNEFASLCALIQASPAFADATLHLGSMSNNSTRHCLRSLDLGTVSTHLVHDSTSLLNPISVQRDITGVLHHYAAIPSKKLYDVVAQRQWSRNLQLKSFQVVPKIEAWVNESYGKEFYLSKMLITDQYRNKMLKQLYDFDSEMDTYHFNLEYHDEFYTYMHKAEAIVFAKTKDYRLDPTIKDNWTEIETLTDSIINMHLDQEWEFNTLWIAVSIIHRLLHLQDYTNLCEFWLTCVTALFIAVKYEEVVLPTALDFSVTIYEHGDYCFSVKKIVSCEKTILQQLDFQILQSCSPYDWLCDIDRKLDLEEKVFGLCDFFIETIFLIHGFLGEKPSYMAAIAVYCAKKVLHDHGEESEDSIAALILHTGYSAEILQAGLHELIIPTLLKHDFKHKYVFRKHRGYSAELPGAACAVKWAIAYVGKTAHRLQPTLISFNYNGD